MSDSVVNVNKPIWRPCVFMDYNQEVLPSYKTATQRVPIEEQERPTLLEHLRSPSFLGGFVFSFLCSIFLPLFALSSSFLCSLFCLSFFRFMASDYSFFVLKFVLLISRQSITSIHLLYFVLLQITVFDFINPHKSHISEKHSSTKPQSSKTEMIATETDDILCRVLGERRV